MESEKLPELNKYLNVPYGKETKEFRDKGGYVLSPSGIGKFFDNAKEWWDDRNGIVTFDGNTNTVLGNAIHAAIDAYWDGEAVLNQDVEDWIHVKYEDQMNTVGGYTKSGEPIAKVDIHVVMKNYMPMFQVWVNEYANMYPKPKYREYSVKMLLQDDIMFAGTVDGCEQEDDLAEEGFQELAMTDDEKLDLATDGNKNVVIDYKTAGKMKSSMDKGHRFQMTAYAMALIAEGKKVDSIRVVYIIRPTKTLPARVKVFEEELTDEMLMEQVEIMELMKKSINVVNQNPELTDVIFKDNPLSMWN